MIYLVALIYLCYLLLILMYWLGWQKQAYELGRKDTRSSISVLIPFKNEIQNLPVLLKQLKEQSALKSHYELIFVDDGSKDGSREYIDANLGGVSNACCLRNEGQGKKSAIATGLKHASFNYVLCLDADIRIGAQHIASFQGFVDTHTVDLIIGPVSLQAESNRLWHRFQSVEFQSLAASTAGSAAFGRAVMCNGANLMFRKDKLQDDYLTIVKAHIPSGDDMFLLEHARNKGWQIAYLKDKSGMAYIGTLPFLRFIKQRKRWASKAFYYREPDILITGTVVALSNIFLFLNVLLSFFYTRYLLLFVAFVILKIISEGMLLKQSAEFFETRGSLRYFFLFVFLQPVYVMFTLLSSLFVRSDWSSSGATK